MEDVERFFRHLVRVLSRGERDRSREPIEIAEIYQSIMPYRHFRGTLGFETNQDYEMALLRLLAGEGGLASVDPIEAQDALSEEARSVNPNPAAYRDYAAAKVFLNTNAINAFSEDRDPYAPPSVEAAPATYANTQPTELVEEPQNDMAADPVPETRRPERTRSTSLPFMTEPAKTVIPPPGLERGSMFTAADPNQSSCPFCNRGLPARRTLKFCPYCGQDISTRRCRSCGTDMGTDWTYCVECGTNALA